MDAGLAEQMIAECAEAEQSARTVADDCEAAALRAALRRLARDRGLRVRTARIDEVVVVVQRDAAIWDDDRATMRAKLTPPGPARCAVEPGQ